MAWVHDGRLASQPLYYWPPPARATAVTNNKVGGAATSVMNGATSPADPCAPAPEKMRFFVELEFIQCLANPKYLHCAPHPRIALLPLALIVIVGLAQSRYFQDPAFLNYLKYLQYWKRPEYAKYIAYPHCLAFLDLLQIEPFRQQLLNPLTVEYIHSQQFYHWQHYVRSTSISNYTASHFETAA